MKVESSDNGFNYLVSELNLDQDSYYQININKEGYVFTIPEIYVPIPYEPIPVISYVNQTGRMNELVIEFNYNLPNLNPTDITFEPEAEVVSIKTLNTGLSYLISAKFARDTRYTVKVEKYGYNFTSTMVFYSYANWVKKDWRVVFQSVGLEYDYYRNYPIFCELFVKKYFIVAIGENGEVPKHYIWTQDFETWEIFSMPKGTLATYGETLSMAFNYWGAFSSYLYVLIADYRSDSVDDYPWDLESSTVELFKINLNNVQDGWELIASYRDFYNSNPTTSSATKRRAIPIAVGAVSSYFWGLNDFGYTSSNTYENIFRASFSSGTITYKVDNLSADEATKYTPIIGTCAGTSNRLFLCTAKSTDTTTTSYARKYITDSYSFDSAIITGQWQPDTWKYRRTDVVKDNGLNQYASYQSYYDNTKWIREAADSPTSVDIPTPFIQSQHRVISRPSNGFDESSNMYKWTYVNHKEAPKGIRPYTIYSFTRYVGGWQAWEQQIFSSPDEGYTDEMAEVVGLKDGYFIMHFVNLGIEYPWFYMSPSKDYSFDISDYSRVVYGSKLVEGKWD